MEIAPVGIDHDAAGQGAAAHQHPGQHVGSRHQADLDRPLDRPQAHPCSHDPALLQLAGARAHPGAAYDVGLDLRVVDRTAVEDGVKANPTAAVERSQCFDVQGAGAGAGVDLGLDPVQSPLGEIDRLSPADNQRFGGNGAQDASETEQPPTSRRASRGESTGSATTVTARDRCLASASRAAPAGGSEVAIRRRRSGITGAV